MSDEVWIGDEPRLSCLARRVLARAVRRPMRLLGIALVLTAIVVTYRAMKAPLHRSTLYFRLSEGELTNPAREPQPPRDVRQYIASVALSRASLEAIMQKYGYSRAWLARDPAAAVASFREDIEIAVSRNFFIYDREAGDPPRSAEVAISFSGADPDQTREILHEIRDAIVQDQAQRVRQLEAVDEVFRAELQAARERAASLKASARALRTEHARASAAERIQLQARIVTAEVEAEAAFEHVVTLERAASAATFSRAAELNNVGVTMVLVDEHLETSGPRLTPQQLTARALVVLAISLLFTALAVGAFDDRVYAPDDLAAQGLPVFGSVPRFPGDDAGSCRARASGRA